MRFELELRAKDQAKTAVFSAADPKKLDQLSSLPAALNGRTADLPLASRATAAAALVPSLKRMALVGEPLETQGFRKRTELEISQIAGLDFIDLTGPPLRVFDWRAVRRWGVSEAQLPPDSEFLFREADTWERYHWQIAVIAAAFCLQSALIAALLLEDRARRVAQSRSFQLMSELARRERTSAMGEMSATIAHEVRQPLAAIVAFGTASLRWLSNKPPDLDEAKKALQSVVDESHRAGDVIQNVRAMFNNDVTPKAPVEVSSVVRRVLELVQAEIKKKHIRLIFEITGKPNAIVKGSEVQLQQVLLNVITNAMEAVDSTMDRERSLRVTLYAPRAGGEVRIGVEDSGPGIDQDNFDNIFNPFFTTKRDGMGLGLSICRSIVDAHGGKMTVANSNSKGAIVRDSHSSMLSGSPVTKAKAECDQPTVFVIDDDDALRNGLISLFRSIGMQVKAFGSVKDFQLGKTQDTPGCLVLDVRLPGKSGLDLQAELNQTDFQMPIIFISGHADVPMSVRAIKAGAVEFLVKPFREQELLDAVRNGFERDQERREKHKLYQELRMRSEALTPREQELFGFVVKGLMNKQIAGEMGISLITVKVHRGNVMQKMRARSLAELVRMADTLGLAKAGP